LDPCEFVSRTEDLPEESVLEEPSEKIAPQIFESATESVIHEIMKKATLDAQRYNNAM
jgi:hypothetical protein